MNESKLKLVIKFLRWFCPQHLLEEIEGDLLQKFQREVKEFGEKSARKRLIALPLAYWLLKEWLNNFAYRVDLSLFVFILVGCVSILLVIVSGDYSAWKAGQTNPVDVIKAD